LFGTPVAPSISAALPEEKPLRECKLMNKDFRPVPVTILRPLKGIDCSLIANLEASFLQIYPSNAMEIMLCVANPADPVIPIVESLLARYPMHDAKLIVGTLIFAVSYPL
jgi:hypothetical protein